MEIDDFAIIVGAITFQLIVVFLIDGMYHQ